MTAWAVTDLPEPDSPSTASVSPSRTSKETPLTALATPVPGAELDLQVPHVEQQAVLGPASWLPAAERSRRVVSGV